MLQSVDIGEIINESSIYRDLILHLAQASLNSRVVVHLAPSKHKSLPDLVRFYEMLPDFADRIEVAGTRNVRDAVEEASAKMIVAQKRLDPLAATKAISKANKDLFSTHGRLRADKVKDVFGLSLTQLAAQLGKSKQSVNQHPESGSLQPLLRNYERIARLRSVLDDQAFKRWLQQANPHLKGNLSPIEFLDRGKLQAAERLADFVENMLTGAPS